jgi:hypothetical protein
MKDETFEEIIKRGIATESEIQLVCCIKGHNIETLNAIIYARTGYEDLEQLKES